ncbi:flavin reductase family protein [Streptomyces sp. CBMA29]|uniref:flavin reductase family protein n=1 Tax=Streptomyces sp. CBMA29 TaxID=1896314 RepID=UPI001661BB75|nr:flavin reductase family protein [Streptomyces sp. CBMA29]
MTTDQEQDIRRRLAHLGIVDMEADTGTKRFPAQALPPEPSAMRQVCGHFTTGITVVTSVIDGQWVGATVNSFTSVSLEPPLVLFCLRHDSRLLAAVRATGTFAVSILGAAQGPVAMGFAAAGPTRFDGLDCLSGSGGAPILRDAIGYLECKVADEYHGGDHRIVVGAVTSLGTLEDDGPLTFYRGRLARLDKER